MTYRLSGPFAGILLALLAPVAGAVDVCNVHFEVAGGDGTAIPTARATKTADAGSCDFDVRLQVAGAAGCAAEGVVLRGDATVASSTEWQHVRLTPRPHRVKRRVLRARVRTSEGRNARARVALRCEPTTPPVGCEDVFLESTYCYLGGGATVRVAGLETGHVCRQDPVKDASEPAPALQTTDLAVWNGDAYTCSPNGAFIATSLDDDAHRRRVAGPCRAVTTDGDALLVLPDAGFDDRHPSLRRDDDDGTPTDVSVIRAYDLPESLPDGPFRVAFDLDTIPAESPCAGLEIRTMTARDGLVYAAGCRDDGLGGCTPDPRICVFDTTNGTTLDLIVLEDFTGAIRGLSAISAGRLVVLTDDQTAVPPIGYFDPGTTEVPAGTDTLHVFDTATGARLDSRPLPTVEALGLACVSQQP